MDAGIFAEFPVAPVADFLVNYDYGKTLLAGKTKEVQTFRLQC